MGEIYAKSKDLPTKQKNWVSHPFFWASSRSPDSIGALLALRAKCRRRVVASTDGGEDAVALSRIPPGTSREEPGSAQPTASDAISPREVLLGMQDTAIWISDGVICAKPSHGQSGMVK